MSKKTDAQYLRWYSERGPAKFGDWFWLQETYLPCIRRFEKVAQSRADIILLSDTYYKLGDIYFFMNAPIESAKCFKKSIEIDPSHGAAYREYGERLGEIGKYAQALRYLQKGLKIDPKDRYIPGEIEYIKSSLKEKSKPLYPANDTIWRLDELLARGQFHAVISRTKSTKKTKILQRRARAFGGLRHDSDLLATWRKIAQNTDEIEMQWADWFYLPMALWNNANFWHILCNCKLRFGYGEWPYHSSLFDTVIPHPKKASLTTGRGLSLVRKRYDLFMQYQIASITRDSDLACKLSKHYPNWPEAKKLKARLVDSPSVARR